MRNEEIASYDLGQMHMGRSGLGVGTVPVYVRVQEKAGAIRVHWCRPMRNEEVASWDLGQMHMGRSGLGVGTVLVCVRVQEKAG
nr:hypothetical protein [Tanacetum cinerariifolium]